ncbi:Alpha/Beta hydrolase protein [Vararia minispora EC-137]|uniref:Alpha/Beta hydrolase protein n=1 Tax=Vararia minispora EC-137 TaxID=1314806 RepID=A0ACB8QLJ1_9AGAM|nr:Alpha/Beta hydrolase protein [Vararia minispora EC-137]
MVTAQWPRIPQIPWHKDSGGVPVQTYNDLVRFTKYASAVYTPVCPRPLGNKLVAEFTNVVTGAHGFVARDDERREIVVAFRGSQQLEDMFTDANMFLVPHGINDTVRVHAGFALAYESVKAVMLETVNEQVAFYDDYDVIVTGHSMGGSLASLAGLAIKTNTTDLSVRIFTFGQPRTGNGPFADLVEATVGTENIFRGLAERTPDGVPTIIPKALGYCHHGTEYWHFAEPPNRKNVLRCEEQEDPKCSRSIPSTGINVAHDVYFGRCMYISCPSLPLA